ncbi:MAG: GGDEF domain-containing protein [Lachnospiraceae bacterium]|nr:GGDEF domain-containing protein [Lachnospiraceae bacterium]
MNHTSYIKNLFYSFVKETDELSERIMFIKHYNTLNLTLEEIEKIVGEDYKEGLLYHSFSRNNIKEPYEPFMNGIRYYYQKLFSDQMTVQEFIDNCEVYTLHKEIFVSYLLDGRAERNEMIFVSEVDYEKERFIESVISCYEYISKKKNLMIILNQFQFAGISTLNLILNLLEQISDGSAKFLIVYNELQHPSTYIEKAFEKVINKAENKNILFEWENDEEVKVNNYHTSFLPNKRYFGEYLRRIANLYYMLAVEDAKYYVDVIHNRIVEEKLKIDKADKFNFYSFAALCSLLENDSNNAMLMCERMLPLYDKENDFMSDYIYNYICGQVQMTLVQSDLTIRYAKKCKEIAKKLNNEKMDFLADVLYQGAQYSGWRDVFSVDFKNVTVDESFIEQLRKNNYLNTLAHYLIYGYDNDAESVRSMAEGTPSKTYEEAIQIGKKLGNTCFLLTAYTKYVVMFTDTGFHKGVDRFYKGKLEILEKSDNYLRKAHLFMGMGYNCIVSERYANANEYFVEAIELLYRLKNAEAITEALYNMAENCICAEDYLSACDYLNIIFKMLNYLGMETIQICNASKLNGLLALSYYKLGNEYQCYRFIGKIEMLISHLIYPEEGEKIDYYRWHEDLFLYYLMSAVLEKNSGNYEEAGKHFEKAKYHFDNYSGVMFYVVTTYIVEYYDYFMRINQPELANEILEFGLEYCRTNNYVLKSKNITMLIDKKNINARPLYAGFTKIGLDELIELAYNVGKEKQLEERKRDIRFLSTWQEILNRDDIEYNALIENTMTALQNNFNLDGILVLEMTEKGIVEMYRDVEFMEACDYEEIFNFFRSMKREFIISRTEKIFMEYDKLISLFGKNKIVTLIGIPVFDENGLVNVFIGTVNMHRNFRHNRILMDEEDLMIMKTAIIQLHNGLERIRSRRNIVAINEKLNEIAITDMLTGLYNRQGFAKMTEEHANCDNEVSILYADLDNFKYYNDTFGHEVGDVILKEFARVFVEVSDKLGYAVRYGGDEFLVVLNNVDTLQACKVAEQIYESISDGFIPVVSRYINEDVSIPKDKFVSCSIGIATSPNSSSENLKNALRKADEALYYMKKHSKGKYITWEDMNEEGN